MRILIAYSVLLCSYPLLLTGQIQTIAGNGQPGFSPTQINNPYGMTIGPDGALYFCEIGNHVVRRLDLKTGQLTVIAGNGTKGYSGDGGVADKAQLNEPYDAKFDSLGNLYIADMQNNAVRRVDARTHIITTLTTDLKQPHCVAIDIDDSILVCDLANNRIQRIDAITSLVSTFLQKSFQTPRSIDFDPGGQMYLALRDPNAIGKVTDRFTPIATVKSPKSISYRSDYTLWTADSENHKILNINMISGNITTAAGTGERGDGPDGDPAHCKLARPHCVLAARDRSIYIADSENHRIRKLIYSQSVY